MLPLPILQLEMASTSKFSYQRLREEGWFDDDDGCDNLREKVIGRQRSSRFRKLHIRRRLKIRIPSLRRFLKRKARLFKSAWTKVIKRLKENQSHLPDLFAGNYLFLQVTPTPLKSVDKSFKGYSLGDYSSTTRYPLSKVA